MKKLLLVLAMVSSIPSMSFADVFMTSGEIRNLFGVTVHCGGAAPKQAEFVCVIGRFDNVLGGVGRGDTLALAKYNAVEACEENSKTGANNGRVGCRYVQIVCDKK